MIKPIIFAGLKPAAVIQPIATVVKDGLASANVGRRLTTEELSKKYPMPPGVPQPKDRKHNI